MYNHRSHRATRYKFWQFELARYSLEEFHLELLHRELKGVLAMVCHTEMPSSRNFKLSSRTGSEPSAILQILHFLRHLDAFRGWRCAF